MSEHHSTPALHPQAAAHLAAAAGAPGVADLSVAQARAATLGYLNLQRQAPAMDSVEHTFMPGPTGDLAVRILHPVPRTQLSPAILILHGSGWVTANLDVVDEPARVLAADTGFIVVTVNYQKAPEHRFPIPFDDSCAAIGWLHENAGQFGIDPSRIAVVGDSAGGNLAAAATNSSVRQHIPVAAQALIYPALDRRQDTGSYREFASGHGLADRDMTWFWQHYVDDEMADDPRVSPVREGDLSGLPPTFIATASHDVLRDEGEAYARALTEAGVDVTAVRYAGMIHGFWWMDGILDTARELQLDLARWLRERLEPEGTR